MGFFPEQRCPKCDSTTVGCTINTNHELEHCSCLKCGNKWNATKIVKKEDK